jgi:hypothetical protein
VAGEIATAAPLVPMHFVNAAMKGANVVLAAHGPLCHTDGLRWRRMRMWGQLWGGVLVSLFNFGVHAVVTGIIIFVTRHTGRVIGEMGAFVRVATMLFVTMIALMAAHIVEITIWAVYYQWSGLQVNNASGFEFAFENYTALGYGDATPAPFWRLTGPITALNGLLLVGWSVAVIFEVLRMAELQFSHIPRRRRTRRN